VGDKISIFFLIINFLYFIHKIIYYWVNPTLFINTFDLNEIQIHLGLPACSSKLELSQVSHGIKLSKYEVSLMYFSMVSKKY